MFNNVSAIRHTACASLILAFLMHSNSAAASAEVKSLAGSLPPGALAYGELSRLDQVIERVQHSEYLKLALTSPEFEAFRKTPHYRKAQAGRTILQIQLGMDLWTAAKKLIGGRVAVALYPKPDSNQPDVVALIRVTDPKILTRLRERLDPLLQLADEQIERSENSDGDELFDLDGKAFVALSQDWLAAASREELLTKTLALLHGTAMQSLADDKSFVAMTRQMGGDHLLTTYVNLETIAKAAGKRLGLPEKSDNPLGSLLVGGFIELAVRSPYAGLTMDVKEHEFTLTAGVAGSPKSLGKTHQSFFSDPAGPGTPAIPKPPSLIGGFTIHRDFADWYRNREELLQPKVLPAFDKFESGLANLLPGRDFGQDVMPLIGKNLTFVSAPQDYSHLDGKPGVKLPGFALLVDLAQPKEAAEIFQLFFQTFSSILNIQAGQQGRQPWIMESQSYKDVQITFGRYLKKPSGKRLPLVFNFMPASARVGDKFIISSSLGLCRQLIDELKKPPNDEKRPNKNLNFEFYLGPFADILEANQEYFQARRIQEGRSPEQAKADIAMYLRILHSFDSLSLSTSVKSDAFQVQFLGKWK